MLLLDELAFSATSSVSSDQYGLSSCPRTLYKFDQCYASNQQRQWQPWSLHLLSRRSGRPYLRITPVQMRYPSSRTETLTAC